LLETYSEGSAVAIVDSSSFIRHNRSLEDSSKSARDSSQRLIPYHYDIERGLYTKADIRTL